MESEQQKFWKSWTGQTAGNLTDEDILKVRKQMAENGLMPVSSWAAKLLKRLIRES